MCSWFPSCIASGDIRKAGVPCGVLSWKVVTLQKALGSHACRNVFLVQSYV